MAKEKVRCSRCILPSNYPRIKYDEVGKCNYCDNWDKRWANWANKESQDDLPNLNAILDSARIKGERYDCLTGLSGGKDSSYAAYICKQAGLKQIAVTFDNGFLTEEAVANINAIVSRLSLSHIVYKHSWEALREMYRNCLVRTGEFCSVCNVGIRAALYRFAKSHRIRTIISGTSPRTEANSPKEYFCCSNGYHKNVAKGKFSIKMINEFMYMGQVKRALCHFLGTPRYIQLPRYMPWKEENILAVLKKETGWQGSEWKQHTDCKMSDAKEYLKLKKFGVSEKAAKLSALIRDRQIDRNKALDIVEEEELQLIRKEKSIRDQIKEVFEISEKELNEALAKNHCVYIPKTDQIYMTLKKLLYR